MLAYIFWHRPYPNTERERYEQAIVRFQNDLAGSKPPGFIGATSFQIEAVPWLSDLPGYEDWYVLDGTWAMDPLNAFAISGHVQAPHDSVAAMMEQGHGGLYAHAGGENVPAPRSKAWRRQMVLGPAAEFAVETPAEAEIDVPAGWQRRRVTRMRLPHPLA